MRLGLAAAAWLAFAAPALGQAPSSSAAQMSAAAERFIALLDDEQRAQAVAAFEDDVERTAWSNLPVAIAPRPGLAAAELDDAQRRALHALLTASLSAQGYLKAASVMWGDQVLHDIGQARLEEMEASGADAARFADVVESWGALSYYVKIYGGPADERWAWGITGHHLAMNFTVADGRLAFTPMFLGAEPEIVEEGRYAGWRVLPQEAARGLELMQSLTDAQRAQALMSETVDSRVFIGAGRKGAEGEPEGLATDALSDGQRALLWAIIEEYVRNADDDAAETTLAAIRADDPAAIRFSWMGPWESTQERYFYRVHGPSILIDYMREGGVGLGGGNHIHTIVRDPRNDYGEAWLDRHYEEHHQAPAFGGGPPGE